MRNSGKYYKIKTKKWFLGKGYFCEYLEKNQTIFNKKTGKIIFIKRDIAGADGLAMNKDEIIFWNSKSGHANIKQGIEEFQKYPYPGYVKRWIVKWIPRKAEPEVVIIA
jgi:hypothetical protein